MAILELTGGNIGFMLIIELPKEKKLAAILESTGGHIEIMLFIEVTKNKN